MRTLEQGDIRQIGDYRAEGKWLVVMVWASNCPVCNREASQYSDFHLMHADEDARILGISLDGWAGREDARAFVDRHQVLFDNVVVDPEIFIPWYEHTAGTRWLGTPTFMLYDSDGILRARQAGAVPVYRIEQFIDAN